MTCPICNDYLTQIRNAVVNRRYAQADAIKALYVQHLTAPHAVTNQTQLAAVRAAFGRMDDDE